MDEMNKSVSLLDQVLAYCKSKLSLFVLNKGFRFSDYAIENETVFLYTINQFQKKWLEEKHIDLLTEAFYAVTGQHYAIEIIPPVDNENIPLQPEKSELVPSNDRILKDIFDMQQKYTDMLEKLINEV